MVKVFDGKIVVLGDYENEETSYTIELIMAEFEEDRPNVIGVLRCTRIVVESSAPSNINLQAGVELFNNFADVEYNNADGDGSYRKEAKKDISKRTGVDISKIVLE